MTETLNAIHVRLRATADEDLLTRLGRLRPRRAARDLLLDWLLIAAGLALAFWPGGLAGWSAAVIVIGSGQYRLFVLGHDGLHGSLHPDTAVNDALSRWAIYGPLFVGFDDSRHSHLVHHRELGTPRDPERYIHSLETKNSIWALLLFCTGLVTFTRTFRKILPHGTFADSGSLASFVRQRLPVAISQIVLLALLLGLGLPWWSWIVLWLLPIYVMVFVPDEIRTFCDHAQAVVPDTAADAQRLVTHEPGPLEAWLLAPHGVHYQAEHHLWPSLPYYNLPAAVTLTRGDAAVDHRGSYLGFLLQLARRLPVAPRR